MMTSRASGASGKSGERRWISGKKMGGRKIKRKTGREGIGV